jgi:hypothetical protein
LDKDFFIDVIYTKKIPFTLANDIIQRHGNDTKDDDKMDYGVDYFYKNASH